MRGHLNRQGRRIIRGAFGVDRGDDRRYRCVLNLPGNSVGIGSGNNDGGFGTIITLGTYMDRSSLFMRGNGDPCGLDRGGSCGHLAGVVRLRIFDVAVRDSGAVPVGTWPDIALDLTYLSRCVDGYVMDIPGAELWPLAVGKAFAVQ